MRRNGVTNRACSPVEGDAGQRCFTHVYSIPPIHHKVMVSRHCCPPQPHPLPTLIFHLPSMHCCPPLSPTPFPLSYFPYPACTAVPLSPTPFPLSYFPYPACTAVALSPTPFPLSYFAYPACTAITQHTTENSGRFDPPFSS